VGEHWSIAALARRDQQNQGPAFAINQGVDLGTQPATGTANGMIVRLSKQIHVIRVGPMWCAEGSCHAGGRG